MLGDEKAQGTRAAICLGLDMERDDYPYTVLASRPDTDLMLDLDGLRTNGAQSSTPEDSRSSL